MQVQDLHATARELPAQLNLERMSHVVMDDNAKQGSPRMFTVVRVSSRDVSHAASAAQVPRPQIRSITRPI